MNRHDLQRYYERRAATVAYVQLYDVHVLPYGARAKRKGFISVGVDYCTRPCAVRFRFVAPNPETAFGYLRSVFRPDDPRSLADAVVLDLDYTPIPVDDPRLYDGSLPVIGFVPPPIGRPLAVPANAASLPVLAP